MFVSEKVVFVELHKTGGTHIGQWLKVLIDGEQIGKHNRVPPALQNRFIIGSIRNPWDWYVSLWAYGCNGSGSVRRQSARRIDMRYCWNELPHEMGLHWLNPLRWQRQVWSDVVKPVDEWRCSYRDSDDPVAFKEWLLMMMDSKRRFDIGEGYGFSPVSRRFGLLTYRYLKLFTNLDSALYRNSALFTMEGVKELWQEHKLVDFLIRNENLEEDLLLALAQATVDLNAEQKAALLEAKNNKLNASERRSVDYYYDRETIELIEHRENFIINSHGYLPPVIE